MRLTLLSSAAAIAIATMGFVSVATAAASPLTTTVCVVGSADPDGVCPPGQGPGGAITGTSTNSSLSVSGGGTVTCTNSTLSGTAPATISSPAGTPVSGPFQLQYSGCTAFILPATVTPSAACDPGGAAPLILNAQNDTDGPFTTVTIPSGCVITISVPTISCTVTVSGPQTIGNGTAGAGGQTWVNGSSDFSTDAINSDTLTAVSSGGGLGCPSAGSHTGTLTGIYTITSDSSPTTAPGATIQP